MRWASTAGRRGLRRYAVCAFVGGLLAIGGVVATALPAAAHAVLESTTPAQGAEVDTPPTTVSLTFGESVTVDNASLRVLGPSGLRVDDGVVAHPGGDGAMVAVGLRTDLPLGSYTVVWRVISADSHPVSGTFSFGYGVAAGAVASSGVHGSRAVGVANGVARFVGYAGLVLSVGVLAFGFFVWRGAWGLLQVRRVFVVGAGLLALSGLALVLLAGPYDAGTGFGQLFAGSLLHTTISTKYGKLLLVRIAVGVLAAGVAYFLVEAAGTSTPGASTGQPSNRHLSISRLATSKPRLDATALAVVGAAAFSVAEHSGTGTQAPLAALMDGIHLLAVSAWVGGLVLLALILLRRQALSGVSPESFLPRWSRLALTCVVLIIATGAYQSWREVGTFPAFATTTYGRLLLVKIGLLVVLIVLGGYGRRWVGRIGDAPSRVSLRRSVGSEVLLSSGVIAVAAVLVNVQPARDTYNPAWSATATGIGLSPADIVKVTVRSTSTRPGLTTFRIKAVSAAGQPLAYQQVSGLLTEPARGLGPVRFTLPASTSGDGATKVVVPEKGHWQIDLQVRVGQSTDYAASTSYLVR
jgi:copper transport protein